MAATFDTHAAYKTLVSAGLTERQAEAIVESQRLSVEQSQLATKADLSEVRRELAETKADIIKWVVSAGIVQTAIIAGLVMALAK